MNATRYIFFLMLGLLLIACSAPEAEDENMKVGLLLPHSIDDQGWNSRGYQGLLNINSKFDVVVFYKEEIDSRESTLKAIDELINKDVSLLFGHGQMYAEIFMSIKDMYPAVHFITFNEEVSGSNVTSIHFEGYAMGFFAGMLASDMSQSGKVGVIAAYPSQPEVEGFVEGAAYQNSNTEIKVDFTSSWTNIPLALQVYERMADEGVDVFYPAGDGYHVTIIEEIKKAGLYVIGYVSDHADLGQSTVLTSTIQHVEEVYELITEKYIEGKLKSGNIYYDFPDGLISLGPFSSEVPQELQNSMNSAINRYMKTGKLPNEK